MKTQSHMRSKCLLLLLVGLGGSLTVVNLGLAQPLTPASAPALPWNSVACSADGTRLVAGAGVVFCDFGCLYNVYPLYISADSGATLTPANVTSYWSSVACSADGTKLVAAAWAPPPRLGSFDKLGFIYRSPDSGATWAITSAPTMT